MALLGGEFGNIEVNTIPKGGELERTLPDCDICYYKKQGYCTIPPERRKRCKFFAPNTPHLWYNGNFWD